MSKPIVYITRQLPEEVVHPYRKRLNIEMWPEVSEPVTDEVLLKKSMEADGLLTMLTDRVDQSIFEKSKQIKIVANMAVGYNNIDIETATRHQVTITNTPDVLTETTADLTFGLLMTTARRMIEANQMIKENKWGHWEPLLLAGTDIHHKTIGIVGMGRIGEATAQRASGFGMNILYHNRTRKPEAEKRLNADFVSFDELLSQSDYVVCLAPLTDETYHMFGKDAFQKMKNEAIFVNVSRGQTVDEEELYEALVQNEIAGAGLDVFENEPIPDSHPLMQLKQVVCLPHIGSATKETRHRMMQLCLENLDLYFQGKSPKTPVNET